MQSNLVESFQNTLVGAVSLCLWVMPRKDYRRKWIHFRQVSRAVLSFLSKCTKVFEFLHKNFYGIKENFNQGHILLENASHTDMSIQNSIFASICKIRVLPKAKGLRPKVSWEGLLKEMDPLSSGLESCSFFPFKMY